MAITDALLLRPTAGADYRAKSPIRSIALVLGGVGVVLAIVTLINNVVAGVWSDQPDRGDTVARLGAWSFGLTTTAFATVKVAIALVLMVILRRLWLRVESVEAALPALRANPVGPVPIQAGMTDTPFGKATVSTRVPRPLLIHRMARAMWGPSLAMGAMAVIAGLVLSFFQTSEVVSNPEVAGRVSAWVAGIQFLGEGFLLAGIAFLLGSILYSLRQGGGEVQEPLGVAVKTLKMPATAKLFVGLMMFGLMVEVFQFVVYVVSAATQSIYGTESAAAYFAWLGPVREAGLGIILAGIVLALVTIGNVLGFQHSRIREIVATGR